MNDNINNNKHNDSALTAATVLGIISACLSLSAVLPSFICGMIALLFIKKIDKDALDDTTLTYFKVGRITAVVGVILSGIFLSIALPIIAFYVFAFLLAICVGILGGIFGVVAMIIMGIASLVSAIFAL